MEEVEGLMVTKRSLYSALVRSSKEVGGVRPLSANQEESMLTHTSPKSIGARAGVESTTYCSAPSGKVTVTEVSMTPSSRAREAKVLSMPKTASPSGASLVRTSLLTSSPASPLGTISRV